MKTKDFYFELPKDQIAQHPVEKRDHSRLLKLNRKTGDISHLKFYDLCNILNEGDCLILNVISFNRVKILFYYEILLQKFILQHRENKHIHVYVDEKLKIF